MVGSLKKGKKGTRFVFEWQQSSKRQSTGWQIDTSKNDVIVPYFPMLNLVVRCLYYGIGWGTKTRIIHHIVHAAVRYYTFVSIEAGHLLDYRV